MKNWEVGESLSMSYNDTKEAGVEDILGVGGCLGESKKNKLKVSKMNEKMEVKESFDNF